MTWWLEICSHNARSSEHGKLKFWWVSTPDTVISTALFSHQLRLALMSIKTYKNIFRNWLETMWHLARALSNTFFRSLILFSSASICLLFISVLTLTSSSNLRCSSHARSAMKRSRLAEIWSSPFIIINSKILWSW